MRYANEDRHVASPADSIKCRVLKPSAYGEVGSVVLISTSVAKGEIAKGVVEAAA
jgi:hypothetical protein